LHNVEILDPILENLLFVMALSILVQIMILPISFHILVFHLHIEHLLHLYKTVPIPRDWKCAKQDPKWNVAMKEEMYALQKNKTWELV